MTDTLQIAIIQTHLVWENAIANRKNLAVLLAQVPDTVQLAILPEMFTTGFSMDPVRLSETMEGPTVQWMKQWATQKNMAICGSIIITENNAYYNRFLFVKPDGTITHYDKRHRFMMAGEGELYTAGDTQVVIEYEGWKLFPQICYDLRFPVFARNTVDYDVVLYVANWPKPRVAAWDALLKARAIENMSYAIGVNRIGLDGNGLEYVGHSGVYNVLGDEIAFAKAEEKIITTTLSKTHIEATRKKLPFLEDQDVFTLET
ncbi:amidohydrolase [uncultured Dokdonia sp.]|uniref:amidohydrolase n=1 Tax=uncultured Dokdonia sp. TaxID=575653 RepID=UPI00261DB380|nr:amidohydrolase [uncultured Dokdonia sp.]